MKGVQGIVRPPVGRQSVLSLDKSKTGWASPRTTKRPQITSTYRLTIE